MFTNINVLETELLLFIDNQTYFCMCMDRDGVEIP